MSKIELLPCPLCGVEYEQKPSAHPLHEPYAEHPREGSPLDGHCIMSGHMFALLPSLVASWNTRSPQPAGVRVKGLRWEAWSQGGYIANMNDLLEYCIARGAVHWRLYVGKHRYLGAFDTIEEAKAAAEADYRQRILSALETQEENWFAVQSVTGTHIGMWRNEAIARRVFEEEYPDGTFIRLYAHPTPVQKEEEGQTVSEDIVERILAECPRYAVKQSHMGTEPNGKWLQVSDVRATLTAALVKP